jgi:hypothetical protein
MIRSRCLLSAILLSLAALPTQAAPILYGAPLGPEVLGAQGTGSTLVTYDPAARTLRVQAIFSGLSGTTTVAHIHGPTAVPFTGTAGVMTPTPSFPSFPVGVTNGSYDRTFDLSLASSWNPAFITASGGTIAGAEARFANALATGRAYLNVHSTTFPGGEIRGFYTPVPEPASLAVIGGLALAGLCGYRRRNAVA